MLMAFLQISIGKMPQSKLHLLMSFGQMSVGQMSLGQMSVGQMSIGQISISQYILAKCQPDKCL